MRRIVLLSPDVTLQREISRALGELGAAAVSAARLSDALKILDMGNVVGALVAYGALGTDEEAIARLVDAAAPHPVFFLADGDAWSAAFALTRLGVRDAIRLPLDVGELRHRLRDVLATGTAGHADGPSRVVPQRKSDVLLGTSSCLQAIRTRITQMARTDLPVAVYGESGTGKELAARMVHCESARRHGSFVVTNCTALPEPLFENDLFGHERDSHAGAYSRSGGLLDSAGGGTIVFDEIGDLSLALQAKLLRLLQFRTYRRVGGTRTIEADVRIIAATNRDLVKAVNEGSFRSDLFYRINVLQLTMPPLRDHLEDLPLLAGHIAASFCRKVGREPVTVTDSAIQKLRQHNWPGNVRELESVIQSTLALRQGPEISAADLELNPGVDCLGAGTPPSTTDVDLSLSFAEAKRDVVERFERTYLSGVLNAANGNVAAAARTAGHDRKSFWRLLQKHGIDVDEYRARGPA